MLARGVVVAHYIEGKFFERFGSMLAAAKQAEASAASLPGLELYFLLSRVPYWYTSLQHTLPSCLLACLPSFQARACIRQGFLLLLFLLYLAILVLLPFPMGG